MTTVSSGSTGTLLCHMTGTRVIQTKTGETDGRDAGTGLSTRVILPPWGRHIGGPPVRSGAGKIGGSARGGAHARARRPATPSRRSVLVAGATATAAGWVWFSRERWTFRDAVPDRYRHVPILSHCLAEGYPWPNNDDLDRRGSA